MKQSGYWPQENGRPITCQEQIKILDENWQELEQVLRDAFDDACLMGVDEIYFQKALEAFVRSLPKNKQISS